MTATEPAKLSNAAIDEYARRVGQAHALYENGKADVHRLVGALGGKVKYSDGNESLHVVKQGDFTIYLPGFTSTARDRFTIAHELGHYFLHYRYAEKTGSERFGRGLRNRAETEANVFASALLMPAENFKLVWEATGGDVWKVAGHFDVSPAAAGVRAEVLRLR